MDKGHEKKVRNVPDFRWLFFGVVVAASMMLMIGFVQKSREAQCCVCAPVKSKTMPLDLRVVIAMISPCDAADARARGRLDWAARASEAGLIAHHFVSRTASCRDDVLEAEAAATRGMPGDSVILQAPPGASQAAVLLAAVRHVAAHEDIGGLVLLRGSFVVLDVSALVASLTGLLRRHGGSPLPPLITASSARSAWERRRYERLTDTIISAGAEDTFMPGEPARFFSRAALTRLSAAAARGGGRSGGLDPAASAFEDVALALWLRNATELADVRLERDAGILACPMCRPEEESAAGGGPPPQPWALRARSQEDFDVARDRLYRSKPLSGECCRLKGGGGGGDAPAAGDAARRRGRSP